MHVKDIRRKWAKIGPFLPKIWGPFLWLSHLKKTRFSASGMGNFAGVRSMTGSRQACTTSLQSTQKNSNALKWYLVVQGM